MPNEKTATDQLCRKLIEDLGVPYEEQKTKNIEINKALKGASKTEKGTGYGKPEFIFQIKNHLFIVEDKLDNEKLVAFDDEERIDTTYPNKANYAVNGACHYAKHIIEKAVGYEEVFAIGVTGDSHSYQIQPYLVRKNEEIKLPKMKSFEEFKEENIDEFYSVAVLGNLPKEERELVEINKISSQLHEDLRNYGQVEGDKKATIVSAILLAIDEENFDTNQLTGNQAKTDGEKIFDSVDLYLKSAKIQPYTKVGVILDQFTFIKTDVTLNTINTYLGKTPLRYFTETLKEKILERIKNNSNTDILGKFYGEFVKYGGSDGNSLGIVLTPLHITQLMTDLIKIEPSDIVLDPCAGTGAFLISAMNTMLNKTDDPSIKEDIKKNRLHGIEIQNKLFTIATTNMILRGDGKSNLLRDDCFSINTEFMKEKSFSKALMNPPYSQAKNAETQHLSELSFILRALEFMDSGKLCAIVPQSTMVGVSSPEKRKKKELLEKHTLETVITLNKETFHGFGVNPCIVVIEAGVPHNPKKRVNFVNFEDDGYKVRKHVGLVGDGTEKGKREHLLDVLEGNEDDDTKFIVKTTVKATDEWLHSFYYFNDDIPEESEFEEAMADYLTFQFEMFSHGKGHLFVDEENKDE